METELDDPWTESAITFAHTERAPWGCKLPFGAFLALVVAAGVVSTYVVIALPLYASIQGGHAGLARDVQNLTSSNVFGQMGIVAIIPIENLAVLSLSLSAEARLDRFAVSVQNPQLQRRLLVHSVTTFGGVFVGTLEGVVAGYFATPSGLQFVNSSTPDARLQDWYIGATRDSFTTWRSPGEFSGQTYSCCQGAIVWASLGRDPCTWARSWSQWWPRTFPLSVLAWASISQKSARQALHFCLTTTEL